MRCPLLYCVRACGRAVGGGEASPLRTKWRVLVGQWLTVLLIATPLGCAEKTSSSPRFAPSTPLDELPELGWSVDTITSIGEMEGAAQFNFVGLTQANVLPGGNFSVLDTRGGRVALFDSTGRHLRSIESRGEGPGEFQLPVAHAVTEEGDLFVLDAQLARLSHFRLGSGELEFVGMRRVSSKMRGLCVLNETLWLGGLVEDKLAHRVDEHGTIEASIGEPPTIEGLEELGEFGLLLAYPQLVRPKVYCDGERELIVMASFSHPRVQAYRSSGEFLWSNDFPGITSIQFERTERGGIRHYSHPERGSYALSSMVPWDDGQMLIQYEIRRDEEDGQGSGAVTLDSRVIDTATGDVLSRSTALPPVLGGNGDIFVVSGQEMFPQALLVRRLHH